MGFTQAELAKILKVRLLTVSRWERNQSPINDAAEMLIRILAAQTLELDIETDVRLLSEKVTDSLRTEEIRIKRSDQGNCQRLWAAEQGDLIS